MNTWTIYLLRDPDNKSVGYVGQTRHTPERRLRRHFVDATRSTSRPLNVWLLAMRARGADPSITVLGTCNSAAEAETLERLWIRWARRGMRLSLVNATSGGQARYGPSHSARVRADWQRPERQEKARQAWADPERRAERSRAISEAHKRPEVRARNAAANKVKANRPEQKRIVSETHRRLWSDPEHRAKRTAALSDAARRRWADNEDYRKEASERLRSQAKRAAEARWGKKVT